MLAEMTPEQFDEWYAMHLVEPWGNEWTQTGTIAAAVHNAGKLTAMAFGGGTLKESDLREADDYVPRWRSKKERRSTGGRRLRPREGECVLRAQFRG